MKKLLLISNSASPGEAYLERPGQHIADFLSGVESNIIFIPYAGVTFSFDEYVDRVNKALSPKGIEVKGIHTYADPLRAVIEASAIIVGGGNTFRLMTMLQETGLLHAIRERVMAGVPYVGWSAGSNVACPTLCTTNDMPIIEPPTFRGLNLVPFQINPHYLDAHPSNHGGETREQRLLEYITLNPQMYAVGLREGTRLVVEGDHLSMVGDRPARIFKGGEAPRELTADEDFDFLMRVVR